MNENIKKVQDKKLHLVFKISFVLFLFSIVVLVVSIYNSDFAEYYSNTISSCLRKILSFISGLLPFSVAEILLFLLPFWLILFILYVVKCVKGKIKILTLIKSISIIFFVLFFLFVNNFAVCYFRNPIEKNMNLNRQTLNRKEIYKITIQLKQTLEKQADSVDFSQEGESINPLDWGQLNYKLNKSYELLNESYPFLTNINSPAKRLFVSPIMTYTHISGIYIPFTSEANVNINYPDYVTVYTTAHEMAHQRGIAGEDEANFVAYLACINSDDEYIKYCGLMSMYDYFLDSLYENDEEMYKYVVVNSDERILKEMYSYYNFFKKYTDSSVSEIADNVNDGYLKSLGVDEGVKSYGKVVELYFAYSQNNKK